MENKQITMLDLVIETHIGLERQGPGNAETVIEALSFLDNLDNISQAADLGCGCGGQTMVLAQSIAGNIIGVDQIPDFINVLNIKAKELNIHDRVSGIVGSMENLPFQKGEFDLIWSEGAIDSIGFEKGIAHWYNFLKKDGYLAVTCPSWLTDEHPDEVEKFWTEAGSELNTIGHNISIMQKIGYSLITTFTIAEKCWTDDYFAPREEAEKEIIAKYPGNEIVAEYIKSSNSETELYSKYKKHYGYVFYIGKKI